MNCSVTLRRHAPKLGSAGKQLAPRTLERIRDDPGEEHVLDQLLRDRAAADQVRPVAEDVRRQRTHHPDGVDARVVVEAPVLDRQHGANDVRRDLRQADLPPLLALAAVERGEQRRFELHRIAGARARDLEAFQPVGGGHWRPAGLRNGRAREDQPDPLAGGRARARHHPDLPLALGELAGLQRRGLLRVAQVVEPIDQLPLAERLALAQFHRPGVDARRRPQPFAVQPLVHQPGEDGVVVTKEAGEHDGDDSGRDDQDTEPPAPPPGTWRRGSGAGGALLDHWI